MVSIWAWLLNQSRVHGKQTTFCCNCYITNALRINSLLPGRFEWNFWYVMLKRILVIDGWGISCDTALIWMSLNCTDDQSKLVQVMAWCRQATSHYLSQCWPSSMSPYGVTRPQLLTPTWWRIYASVKWVTIGSGNGVFFVRRRKAITYASVDFNVNWIIRNLFREIWTKMQNLLFEKLCLNMSSVKRRPFYSEIHILPHRGLNEMAQFCGRHFQI